MKKNTGNIAQRLAGIGTMGALAVGLAVVAAPAAQAADPAPGSTALIQGPLVDGPLIEGGLLGGDVLTGDLLNGSLNQVIRDALKFGQFQ